MMKWLLHKFSFTMLGGKESELGKLTQDDVLREMAPWVYDGLSLLGALCGLLDVYFCVLLKSQPNDLKAKQTFHRRFLYICVLLSFNLSVFFINTLLYWISFQYLYRCFV